MHGEGDYFGKPFKLRAWQKRLIWRAYELEPDGSRRYSRVLLGLPKGNGKTELAAAIACCELGGPVVLDRWGKDGKPMPARRLSPDIPVAAASFDQADELFGAARTMISEGLLADYFDVFDTEILPKDGPGRMYRVAAVAGTNDGRRPTFFLADEVHEWEGKKERVHLVLSNGLAKREDSWGLSISTAGYNMASLLGRMYKHGKEVSAGEVKDPSFLFEWYEPSDPELDLSDRQALEEAIRETNPAADDFLPIENLFAKSVQIPEFEFRRYNLNQWVSAPDRWLPQGMWEARADDRDPPEEGTPVVLGFDGSYSGDSTALVGCTTEGTPHIFVAEAWEKPEGAGDWRVDILDVEQAVRNACAKWQVNRIGCDPYRWQRSLAVLEDEGFPVIEWPSHLPSRMVPACAQFYDAVTGGGLTHDGDERLAAHIANCVVKIDSRGPRITKDHKDSVRHIDLAVAAVLAFDLAVREQGDPGWRPV
ncbi:MAG: terminase large subunit domain-containing protein [Gemmatimonadales bacterium]